MKNITTGHWVFAAIFAVVFIVMLVLAYRKDGKTIRQHYSRSIFFLIGVVMVLFLTFVFRQTIRGEENNKKTQADSIVQRPR